MINKVLEAAQTTIRCQEGTSAMVDRWRCIDARNHEVIVSVTLSTEKAGKNRMFTVWVIANLDTEEVYCP